MIILTWLFVFSSSAVAQMNTDQDGHMMGGDGHMTGGGWGWGMSYG